MSKKEPVIGGIREVLELNVFKDINEMVNSFAYSEDFCQRCLAAACGKHLEILLKDPNYLVRKEVARLGYGLELLINDPDYSVRVELVRHGYCLDTLMGDDDWHVRLAVAESGYRPDILRHDSTNAVSEAANKHIVRGKHIQRGTDSIKKAKFESENYMRIETYKFELFKLIREATYDLDDGNTIERILKKLEFDGGGRLMASICDNESFDEIINTMLKEKMISPDRAEDIGVLYDFIRHIEFNSTIEFEDSMIERYITVIEYLLRKIESIAIKEKYSWFW